VGSAAEGTAAEGTAAVGTAAVGSAAVGSGGAVDTAAVVPKNMDMTVGIDMADIPRYTYPKEIHMLLIFNFFLN
jgi:hypothetical protein